MTKLLLIEDQPHQRDLFTEVLTQEGHKVDSVDGGRAGISAVKANKYDLVVLDIAMCDMDGIETLSKILSHNNTIPIILYSAYSHHKDNFMTWSADAFVLKSSDMNGLKRAVKEVLANRNQVDVSSE